MEKTKVLYISEVLSSYNDPIYEIINNHVDLTFAWVKKQDIKETKYKTFQFPYKKIGKFIFHKNLREIINRYDVVIISPYLRFPRICLLPFLSHKPKLISWSIGLHVSYKRKYDLSRKPDFEDKIYQMIQNHCDACIYYMPQPIEYWKKYSRIDERKFFVAHNTVKVADYNNLPVAEERNKFLFIGTLYQQKGLTELIEAYSIARKKQSGMPYLYIIGKGPEKELINSLIENKGLTDYVIMMGAIYDEEILKEYFLSSLLCISPKQAGLSVQKSLGYGVPFVTRPDAITGGERFDVIDKETGFYYQTVDELSEIMVNAVMSPSEIDRMSKTARNYYLTKASPEIMAQGALDAIEYVMNK